MSAMPRPRRFWVLPPCLLPTCVLLASALLSACAGRALQPPAAGPGREAPPPATPSREAVGARVALAADSDDTTLAEIDRLLSRWDEAQAGSRVAEADVLGAQIAAQVESAFVLLLSAARGERGQAGSYVGTMALAFSRRPEATAVLAERLAERDLRLVANALIALKLRADPATPLSPIVAHVASPHADLRRYAPLALAHVLEARRRVGQEVEPELLAQALQRLVRIKQDQDPHVRLHTARALGELGLPEAAAALLPMLDDTSSRVALGAAAALARCGGRPGFERVVQLLHNSAAEAQPLLAGTLVVYAERLQGAPLSAAELRYLGSSAPAWARWYAEFVKR